MSKQNGATGSSHADRRGRRRKKIEDRDDQLLLFELTEGRRKAAADAFLAAQKIARGYARRTRPNDGHFAEECQEPVGEAVCRASMRLDAARGDPAAFIAIRVGWSLGTVGRKEARRGSRVAHLCSRKIDAMDGGAGDERLRLELSEVLERLGATARDILIRREVAGHRLADLAADYGLTQSAVKASLRWAKKRFREMWGDVA